MLTYATFESKYGVGFVVSEDGVPVFKADYTPNMAGFQGMTEAEAIAEAEAEIAARQAQPGA